MATLPHCFRLPSLLQPSRPFRQRMLLPQAVKVNSLGKWKTALQMVGISALLALRHSDRLIGAARAPLNLWLLCSRAPIFANRLGCACI